jgi:hypothetical protein
MMVMPEFDAVVAITSGVRDMRSVMNLVWDKLLPAFQPKALAENPAGDHALASKLASLSVRAPAGRTTAALASRVSGHWYELPANDRGMRAVALDLTSSAPALLVRTAAGETRTPIGVGKWAQGKSDFNNGIDQMLSVLPHPAVATSGAWTSDSTYTVKMIAPETPFYSTMDFLFTGDRLLLDTEYNVSFGVRKPPRLEGRRAP